MDPMLMDKRVVERNIENGTLTRAEYEKHCDKLPDLTDECEEVEVSLYKTDEDEEEEESGEEGEIESDESVELEGQAEG